MVYRRDEAMDVFKTIDGFQTRQVLSLKRGMDNLGQRKTGERKWIL
jgi:hypothetical protein